MGRDFVIFDPSDQKSLVKQVLAELKLPEKQFHPKKVLELISDFKNRCLLPEEARAEALDPWTRKLMDAYDLYQKGLKNSRACDFDDLLLHTERLFRDGAMQEVYAQRFRFLLVDEYQDTNRAQYLLVQHLAQRHHNLCVVGDEDQSIYGWRGADIRNILDFQRDFPEAMQIKLEQNYRSTQKILDAASTVIANNSQRLGKTLWTERGIGDHLTFKLLDEGRLEADWVVQRILEEKRRFPGRAHRGAVPGQLAVPAAGGNPPGREPALQAGRRREVLRAPGSEGSAGLSPPRLEPLRSHELPPRGQRPHPGRGAHHPRARSRRPSPRAGRPWTGWRRCCVPVS